MSEDYSLTSLHSGASEADILSNLPKRVGTRIILSRSEVEIRQRFQIPSIFEMERQVGKVPTII